MSNIEKKHYGWYKEVVARLALILSISVPTFLAACGVDPNNSDSSGDQSQATSALVVETPYDSVDSDDPQDSVSPTAPTIPPAPSVPPVESLSAPTTAEQEFQQGSISFLEYLKRTRTVGDDAEVVQFGWSGGVIYAVTVRELIDAEGQLHSIESLYPGIDRLVYYNPPFDPSAGLFVAIALRPEEALGFDQSSGEPVIIANGAVFKAYNPATGRFEPLPEGPKDMNGFTTVLVPASTGGATEVAEVGAEEAGEAGEAGAGVEVASPEEAVSPASPAPASPVPASPVAAPELSQQPDVPLEAPTMVPPVPYESPEITNKWEAFPRRVEQAYVLQYEGTGPEAGISFPIEIGVSLSNTPWGLQRFSFEFSELFIQKYGKAYLEVAHHKYNQQHPDDKISYEEYLNKVRAGEGQYFYNYYNQLPNGKFEVAEGRATIDPRDGVAIGFEFVDDRPIFTPGGPTLEQKAAKWPKRSSLGLRPFHWYDPRLNNDNQPAIVMSVGADTLADEMQKLLRKNDPEEVNIYLKSLLSIYLSYILQQEVFQWHLAQNNRGYLERTLGEGGGAKEMEGMLYPSYVVWVNAWMNLLDRPDLIIDESVPRTKEQYQDLFDDRENLVSEFYRTATEEDLLEFYSIFVRVIVGN